MRDGLRLFGEHVDRLHRRRRIAAVALIALTTAALVWPGYAPFAGIHPRVFGLPLSLAWVILWILVVFGVMVWLYRSDAAEAHDAGERPAPPSGGHET